MRDGQGVSKGFGFICFADPSAAEKATSYVLRNEATDGDKNQDSASEQRVIKGVKLGDLYVREAKKKEQRHHELQMNNFKYKKSIMFFSLFVKNFPIGTTEEELKIYFSSACQGDVTKVQIIPGTQQAFVNFEKQDQCKLAKDFARNVLFKSQYALYVEYCYPKEMRLIRNEELIDRKAQEKKRNQQNQAQIASLSGSQNLIDLLTMLLKPAFQFNQGMNNQKRSHSYNSTNSRVPRLDGSGYMMQQRQYVNNRTNFQGPNRGYQPGDMMGQQAYMMNRGNSMNMAGA